MGIMGKWSTEDAGAGKDPIFGIVIWNVEMVTIWYYI